MTGFKITFLIFSLTLFILSVDCWFWDQSYAILNRTKRQNKCNGEHECGSGECISEDNVCDGTVHCQDGSDETNACANIRCQAYLFRCKYGACINPEYECDGKQDCRDNSDETSFKCRNSPSRPNTCPAGKFSCNDGECIEDVDQCDGVRNCKDGSDETVENCSRFRCQKYTFRCSYGACINADLQCDGKLDCADNSDEFNCPNINFKPTPALSIPTPVIPTIGPTEAPNTNGGCVLPPFPENGKWTVYGGFIKNPGEIVSENTLIMMECKAGFKLYPDISVNICKSGGRWENTYKCIRTCSSIYQTNKLEVTCRFNGGITPCENPYEGTTAYLKCARFYENSLLASRPQRLCFDGSWNKALPDCEPVCGLTTQQAEKLLVGGQNVTRGDYPWHVGVYLVDDVEPICGASIITPKITLSAAHCFELDDPKRYRLAAGKVYSTYEHPEDKQAQYSQIRQILKHPRYNSIDFEDNDLAILILEKPFKIGSNILPVCFDAAESFDYSRLHNKVGVVVGWGFTEETGVPSKTLKHLAVDYKSKEECIIPKNFQFYYQPYSQDKVCAGLLHQGKSACKGDSGGGLVFRGDNDRYFIRGIVSVGPHRIGGCNSSQLTLYTGVSYHKDLIFQEISKHPE